MFRVARRLALLSTMVGGLVVGTAAPAPAHIRDRFEGVDLVLGWAEEPAFASLPNAVQLILTEPARPAATVPPRPAPSPAPTAQAQEVPVDPEQVKLTVVVVFGEGDAAPRSAPMPLTAFRFGRPGEFRSEPISPTRPGTYTFHITGTIKGKAFDRSYTSGEKGAIAGTKFNDIQELGPVSFPERDPSNRELALAVDRVERSADRGNRLGQILGVIGIALGLVATGVAVRRRPRG
ncbi:MAG: hypothetical protein M3133_05680 [Actinomycetota bacterium]|nr:hypothetical protein [Actinomycetota bacterium]